MLQIARICPIDIQAWAAKAGGTDVFIGSLRFGAQAQAQAHAHYLAPHGRWAQCW